MYDDNARPNWSWITTEFLAKIRVESYPNASYSSSLRLCDFFLFSKLKNQLREGGGVNHDEMLDALDNVMGSLTNEDFPFPNYFSDWFSRVDKWIDAKEEYFEKIN